MRTAQQSFLGHLHLIVFEDVVYRLFDTGPALPTVSTSEDRRLIR